MQINVIASVPGSGQRGYGVVNINPEDVNDNAPVFSTCCIGGTVNENNGRSEL